METKEVLKFGVWESPNKEGYFTNGKPVTIDGKDYWIGLYANTNKLKESSPDYNITLKAV